MTYAHQFTAAQRKQLTAAETFDAEKAALHVKHNIKPTPTKTADTLRAQFVRDGEIAAIDARMAELTPQLSAQQRAARDFAGLRSLIGEQLNARRNAAADALPALLLRAAQGDRFNLLDELTTKHPHALVLLTADLKTLGDTMAAPAARGYTGRSPEFDLAHRVADLESEMRALSERRSELAPTAEDLELKRQQRARGEID